MRNLSTLGFLSLLPLAGCDAAEDFIAAIANEADARQAMSAMVGALSNAQPSEQGQSDTVLRAAGGGEQLVDIAVPCQGGGQVRFEGSLDLGDVGNTGLPEDFDPTADDVPTNVDLPTVSFAYAVRFEGCTVDGVVLDGSLDYTLETRWDDSNTDLTATWDYVGRVDVSGAVEGRCDFSFGGIGDVGADSWAAGVPTGFDGDVCGYEAASTLGE